MRTPTTANRIGEEIGATMADLAKRWPLLSEGERRRTLDEYSPRMAELLGQHTAALAEEMPPGG